jgi:hypothetical protein
VFLGLTSSHLSIVAHKSEPQSLTGISPLAGQSIHHLLLPVYSQCSSQRILLKPKSDEGLVIKPQSSSSYTAAVTYLTSSPVTSFQPVWLPTAPQCQAHFCPTAFAYAVLTIQRTSLTPCHSNICLYQLFLEAYLSQTILHKIHTCACTHVYTHTHTHTHTHTPPYPLSLLLLP